MLDESQFDPDPELNPDTDPNPDLDPNPGFDLYTSSLWSCISWHISREWLQAALGESWPDPLLDSDFDPDLNSDPNLYILALQYF